MMPTLESFKWRLAETIAWWEHKKTLRSEELRPEWYTESAMSSHVLSNLSIVQRIYEMNQLSIKRAELLRKIGKYPLQPAKGLSNGRLVICEIDMSVWDGASEQDSKGFFDVYDAPPWNLWLFCLLEIDSYGQHYSSFMAWTPSTYIELVKKGMEVNMVEIIAWAENSNNSFIKVLREAGFVSNLNSL